MDKVQKIIEMTAIQFGIDESLLRQTSYTKGAKKREVANARMVAMVLIKEHTTMTLKAIGHEFAGRDHTTVLNALKVVPDLVETEKNFRNSFKQLSDSVRMRFSPVQCVEIRFEELGYAFI